MKGYLSEPVVLEETYKKNSSETLDLRIYILPNLGKHSSELIQGGLCKVDLESPIRRLRLVPEDGRSSRLFVYGSKNVNQSRYYRG